MSKPSPEQLMAILDGIPDDPEGRVDGLVDALTVMSDLTDRLTAGEHRLRQDWAKKTVDDVTFVRVLSVYNGLWDVKARFDSMVEGLDAMQRDQFKIESCRLLLDGDRL